MFALLRRLRLLLTREQPGRTGGLARGEPRTARDTRRGSILSRTRDHARLVGLRGILVAFALALAVAAAFALTSWLIVPLDYHARFPLMLAFALLTYCLGFLGWRNCFVTFPRAPAPAPEPAPDSGEAPRARREQAERLAATVRQSGWWRDPELDLASLAARLALSERTLSRLLGEGLGKSFREFVGGLRVDAVAADLDAGDGRALLEIALAAGFQSKASFNRVFLAHRGMTPSAYRRRSRGEAGLSTRQAAAAAGDEAT